MFPTTLRDTVVLVLKMFCAALCGANRKVFQFDDLENYTDWLLTQKDPPEFTTRQIMRQISGLLRRESRNGFVLHCGKGYYDVTPWYWRQEYETARELARQFQGRADVGEIFAGDAEIAHNRYANCPSFPASIARDRSRPDKGGDGHSDSELEGGPNGEQQQPLDIFDTPQ